MAGKIHVIFDDRGRIRATAVSAHEQSDVRPGFGMHVHTIDHPGLEREKMTQFLIDLHRKHRVDRSTEKQLVLVKDADD
jgi:hypothetical protein